MLSYAGYPFTPFTPELRLRVESWWREEAPALWEWPGYATEGIHHLPIPDRPKSEHARLNTLVWPTGASRWAVFHGLMGDANAAAVQAACSTTAPTAQTLLMRDEKTGNQISTQMFMVDVRAVYDFDNTSSPGLDGDYKGKRLWWLTLVDERFFWWQAKLSYTFSTTWSTLLTNLVSAATNGESVTVPTVSSNYGNASSTRWQNVLAPLPLLIDAAGYTVGLRFVRLLDGTLKYVDAPTALADDQTRWTNYGGERVLGTRTATTEVIGSVPASVNVGFGAAATPPTVTNKTLASLALTEYGSATGVANAAAWIFGDLPSSASGTDRGNYATQAATDYYRWCLSLTDATLRNIQPLPGPVGIEDRIEWEYQPGRRSFADKDALLADQRLPVERLATRIVKADIADRNLYGFVPGVQAVGGDVTFLALLIAKDYTLAPFITYSWVRVKDTAGAGGTHQITYDFSDTTAPQCGGPSCTPAYHLRNLDLPVWHGTFTPSPCCDPPSSPPSMPIDPPPKSVVRMWPSPNGSWMLFGEHPWEDLFRRTGTSDSDGEIAYLRYWDQNTQTWQDGQEVRLVFGA